MRIRPAGAASASPTCSIPRVFAISTTRWRRTRRRSPARFNLHEPSTTPQIREQYEELRRAHPAAGLRYGGAARRRHGAGQADPVRRRAGHHARYRSRHLSVCHLVQRGGRRSLHRHRRAAHAHSRRHRRFEGLHHARRVGAVSHREHAMPPAICCAAKATSSAPSPAVRAAAAGSTCRCCATRRW